MWKLIALTAAGIGVFFFPDPGGNAALPGIVLALASAVTYGCYLTGMDKTPLRRMNPNKVACYMGFTNAMAILLVDIPVGKINFFLPPLAMGYTFLIAICTSFLAVALLQKGIQDLGASTAAIFCMFEPVSSVLSGWLILHETMTPAKLMGLCGHSGRRGPSWFSAICAVRNAPGHWENRNLFRRKWLKILLKPVKIRTFFRKNQLVRTISSTKTRRKPPAEPGNPHKLDKNPVFLWQKRRELWYHRDRFERPVPGECRAAFFVTIISVK